MSQQSKKRLLEQLERKNIVRSKRKKIDLSIPNLPSELIFNILSKLPADFLQDSGKYVCKTWAKIISDPNFVEKHLLHSNAGVLIQIKVDAVHFLEAKEGKISMMPQKQSSIPFEVIATSCAGIVLCKRRGHNEIYVANCITKQWMTLPDFYESSCRLLRPSNWGIAYIPCTRELKVVIPCKEHKSNDGSRHVHVVTLGGMANWRKISFKLECSAINKPFSRPISVDGIVYWVYDVVGNDKFVSMDLSDESIRLVKVPKEFVNENGRAYSRTTYGFQKMGSYLSSIVKEKDKREINVWILKNSRESEWVKIRKIECCVRLIEANRFFIPIVWLEIGRVLLLMNLYELEPKLIVYKLSSGQLSIISNVLFNNSNCMFEHTKSLVSW